MKAETKAKRRVTLSLVGLGLLDESELATIPNARIVDVDATTGKITGSKPVAIEAGPVSSNSTDTAVTASAEVADWTAFWGRLRARKIDAETYESIVGRKAPDFPSPQAALNALREAENGAGTQPAPDQPEDVIEVDGLQVDPDTGEIVPPEPAPEKPAASKKPPVFGQPPVPADQHTSR
jgi:hypothetical protein